MPGAQTDFGSNIFVGPDADNTVIQGLHLQAGSETSNKLLEIWANNVTVKNDFIDTFFNGHDTGAAAIYFNDNGTTFTDEIASYDVADNILNNSVVISNGVGDDTQGAIGANQLITGNTFEGVYVAGSGLTSYDTILVQGDVPGFGWLLEPAQIPTATGNDLDNNGRPFLLRGSDTYGSLPGDATPPSAADIANFIHNNTDAGTAYAYVLNGDNSLHLVNRGSFESFYVTNGIATLDAGQNGTDPFGSARNMMDPGDIVIVQTVGPTNDDIVVNNLTVDPTATSTALTFTLDPALSGVTSLTLGDYDTVNHLGTNVTVVANSFGDTVTPNDGSDTLTGGAGTDTAVYTQALTTSAFTFSGGAWHVAKAGGASDTITGFEKVSDNASHNFLLVGGGSQYATIQEAVDAAQAGDTILVAPGTYTEQVVVDPAHGHGANGISIVGIGLVTLDAPISLISTGHSPTNGRDIDGIFTVSNASNVTIEGISVNGLQEGAPVTGANNPTLVGIAYLNASGTVDHVDVTGIRENEAGFGIQRGIGIYGSNAAAGQSLHRHQFDRRGLPEGRHRRQQRHR